MQDGLIDFEVQRTVCLVQVQVQPYQQRMEEHDVPIQVPF